jgi:hypothetical protein
VDSLKMVDLITINIVLDARAKAERGRLEAFG